MGTQPEIDNYDPTVYEIETTDLLLGGPGGPLNEPLLNLANRTNWLKAQVTALGNGTINPQMFWSTSLWDDSGATNALSIALNPAPSSMATLTGIPIRVLVKNTITGAPTINVNGLGAVAIVNPNGGALVDGQMTAAGIYELVYNGTEFQLQSISGVNGGFPGWISPNANTTLTSAVANFAVLFNSASAITITLPLAGTFEAGQTLTFYGSDANNIIATQGSDIIWAPFGGDVQPLTVPPGTTVVLMSTGAGQWDVIGGSILLQYVPIAVGAATSAKQAAQLGQVQVQATNYAMDTGAVNALAVTLNPAPASLMVLVGVPIRVKVGFTNTNTAPTINVNGFGAVGISTPNGVAVQPNQIHAGGIATFIYDGAVFELQSISVAPAPGVVGDARNLAMSVTAPSATATLTADEIIVKSALGGIAFTLANFNESINLATTGAGGMDNGVVPDSGFVALYAIYNPMIGAAALLATNATGVIAPSVYGGAYMPAGYTASALVSVWKTGTTGEFAAGIQVGREISVGYLNVASTTVQVTAITEVNISTVVPVNAKTISGGMSCISADANGTQVTIYSSPTGIASRVFSSYANQSGDGAVGSYNGLPIITPQVIYWQAYMTLGTFQNAEVYITNYSI